MIGSETVCVYTETKKDKCAVCRNTVLGLPAQKNVTTDLTTLQPVPTSACSSSDHKQSIDLSSNKPMLIRPVITHVGESLVVPDT